MNKLHVMQSAQSTFVASILIGALLMVTFFVSEPVIGQSAQEQFQVTQTVSGAISFLASSSPVVMNGTLDGLTGGTSYGTTTARVRTNASGGYNMTIRFASTSPMIRNTGGGYIPSYLYSTSTSDYPSGFNTSPANAQFGFTVNASTTDEVSSVFKGNGTTLCGASNGSTFVSGLCWRGASTTDAAATTLLINSTSQTPSSGSTSTVQFRITIPNNPSPAVPDGTYTATATLTATEN
jgi:hypothetical protein